MSKPFPYPEYKEVAYDERRWRLLRSLRSEAVRLMEALHDFNIDSVAHGSIARGDVSPRSDVDVFTPNLVPPLLIEMALESAGFQANRKLIVQATPSYAVKGYLELGEQRLVSFPLTELRPREMDFYKFSGCLNLEQLKSNVRIFGVNKKLMLIEPTSQGHKESSIVGREGVVAKRLGVSLDLVNERVRTLLRRDRFGRTGVFMKRELRSDEGFEEALSELAAKTPNIRRKLGR
jgi:hypothetical protein